MSGDQDGMEDELLVLRRMYPDGVIPEQDYLPLLAALYRDMSYHGVAELVGAFTGRDYKDIYFDVMGSVSDADPADRPPRRDTDRLWVMLLDNGWVPETPPPRAEKPGFIEEAAAILRHAYPGGIEGDDYLPVLVALNRDIGRSVLADVVVTAFPALDRRQVFFDAGEAGRAAEVAPDAVERAWQHLVASGWTGSS
jgi:hypothetical protein